MRPIGQPYRHDHVEYKVAEVRRYLEEASKITDDLRYEDGILNLFYLTSVEKAHSEIGQLLIRLTKVAEYLEQSR